MLANRQPERLLRGLQRESERARVVVDSSYLRQFYAFPPLRVQERCGRVVRYVCLGPRSRRSLERTDVVLRDAAVSNHRHL